MNMCAPMTVVDGFAAVGIPDTWLMPFLLRATPRLDLVGWSLRSEVNLDGDRAFWRHIRPDPQRYETSQRLPSSLHQGVLRTPQLRPALQVVLGHADRPAGVRRDHVHQEPRAPAGARGRGRVLRGGGPSGQAPQVRVERSLQR